MMILRKLCLAASLLATLTLAPLAGAQPAVRYDGHRSVRVLTPDEAAVATALDIGGLLSCRPAIGTVDIHVAPADMQRLRDSGLAFVVLHEDIQALIDAEAAAMDAARQQRGGNWFLTYRTLAEYDDYVDTLVALNPAIATRFSVGTSLEGREIFGIRITGPGAGKPQVVLNGCQHAREWIAPAIGMYVADALIRGYGIDTELTGIVDTVEFHIIPIVNPDGYVYTHTSQRLWRKNRRNNGNGTTGVDLNRNWSYQWGGSGSSGSGSSDIYRGASPFSEPETTAISNYMLSLPRASAHIDFHSFSQLILYPWGYTFNQLPEPTRTIFDDLANEISAVIQAEHGAYYRPQPASDLYIADGIASDWSYSEGMWGFTIELRPDENSFYQFELPPEQIIPTGEENLQAVLTLAEFVAYPIRFSFPGGQPTIVNSGLGADLTVTVTATSGDIDQSSVSLFSRVGSSGPFTESPMIFEGQEMYTGELVAADCGEMIEWYVAASTLDGTDGTYPNGGEADPASAQALDIAFAMLDEAESDNGWTVGASGDNATTGIWGRMDPQATGAQPEDDHTPSPGTDCWITDGRAGSGIGTYDVDNGTTTLTSPVMDATGGLDAPIAVLSYWRWYSNDQGGAANEDTMPVDVSFDGGSTWTQLEDVSENANAWVYKEFVLNDFAEPTANVRVRFRARDLGSGSIVEAGVDDIGISVYGCDSHPGDYNGDGDVNTIDVLDFLNDWVAGDPMADWNHDGSVNTLDVLAFLNDWNMG